MERGEESRECNKGLDSLRTLPPMAVHLCGILCECECVEEMFCECECVEEHYRSASNFRGVLAKLLEERVIKYFWHLKQDRPEEEKSEQSNVGNISRGSMSSFCFITLILDLF